MSLPITASSSLLNGIIDKTGQTPLLTIHVIRHASENGWLDKLLSPHQPPGRGHRQAQFALPIWQSQYNPGFFDIAGGCYRSNMRIGRHRVANCGQPPRQGSTNLSWILRWTKSRDRQCRSDRWRQKCQNGPHHGGFEIGVFKTILGDLPSSVTGIIFFPPR